MYKNIVMPEGPSIVILKEALKIYEGQKVVSATGNAKIDIDRLVDKEVIHFKSWGKHTLICFQGFYLRIHFLMFGTYRINERKNQVPRLQLNFLNGEVSFYTCSIKLIDGEVDKDYDWEADVMSEKWKPMKAEAKLKEKPQENVCDVLLDQEIFAGVGNIIKNEVLFRIKVHPESVVGALSSKKLKELIREARNYSFDFLYWKKDFVLRQHWQIYKKKECPRCKIPSTMVYMGKGKRMTFYCANCQQLYRDITL